MTVKESSKNSLRQSIEADFCMDMASKINFYTEGIQFKLKHKYLIRNWLETSAHAEGYYLKSLNIIFCNDEYLLAINQQFLQHDFYTDIITFDYNSENRIIGELYISTDRIQDNANKNNIRFENELYRIIIHGVLHLCGYKDKLKSDIKTMRQKEEIYLNKITKIVSK
jgi:probable rRNA maturation factor